jgi:hypothetical protein
MITFIKEYCRFRRGGMSIRASWFCARHNLFRGEMMAYKLSKWQEKMETPEMIGVYEVAVAFPGIWYSFWDGEKFNCIAYDVQEAENLKNCFTTQPSRQKWRGIIK